MWLAFRRHNVEMEEKIFLLYKNDRHLYPFSKAIRICTAVLNNVNSTVQIALQLKNCEFGRKYAFR